MADRHQRFNAVVAALLPHVYRYAYWLCRDRESVEDIVQEALVRAWKAIDSLDDDTKAKSWLFTIVRREHARHHERRRLDTVALDGFDAPESDWSPPEADAELADLRRMIGSLDAKYREPLVLQVAGGCTCDEIGELLGLPRATVLTRLFRARKQLTRKMEEVERHELPGISP